jgi:hypothetical protein
MKNRPRQNAGAAFRRFEEVMRKLVRVPKKDVDAKIAAERRVRRPRRKPA